MALLFFDGFDYVADTGGGPNGCTLDPTWQPLNENVSRFQTDADRYGGRCLNFSAQGVKLTEIFNGQTEIFFGFDFYKEGRISGTDYVKVYANGIEAVSMEGNDTTNWGVYAYVNGVKTLLTNVTFPDGQWRYYEVRLRIGNSGALEIRREKQTLYSNTNLNINTGGTIEELRWYASFNGSGYEMRLNDVYVCDTSGTKNNTFLNMPKVRHLILDADSATANDLTGSSGVDKFQLVSELPTNLDTNYVFGPLTAGLKQRCTGVYTQNNPIAGVNVVNVTKLTGSGVFQAQGNILLDNGTTEVTGLPADTNVEGQSYGATKGVVIEAAADGSDLTAAHLAAMEFGIEFVG